MRRPRLLALTAHPAAGAGARYRLLQYLPYLEQLGFDCETSSFFTDDEFAATYNRPRWSSAMVTATLRGTVRRAIRLVDVRRFDVVFAYLWLHPFTFPLYQWQLRQAGVPLVYDLDDPFYEKLGSQADRFRSDDWLFSIMQQAHTVTVSNQMIHDVARRHSRNVVTLPTVVDYERFTPRSRTSEPGRTPVIGWIGSPYTFHYLRMLEPALRRLAERRAFTLRVIGPSSRLDLPGVSVENPPYSYEREPELLRDLDIGVYPLIEDTVFARNKPGFKLNQYRAAGVPFVASRIPANLRIVDDGETGFLAGNDDEWVAKLERLIDDVSLRERIAKNGREFGYRHTSLQAHLPTIADILRSAVASRKGRPAPIPT